MPKFVVQKSADEPAYMKFHPATGIVWVSEKELANSHSSKYAAKCHLQIIRNIPKGMILTEF